jgi:hypothetical protein
MMVRRSLAKLATGDVGLVMEPIEVTAGGWPWDMRIVVRYRDFADDADGNRVYDNDGVIYAHAKWGRIVRQTEFHSHPELVDEFDAYRESEQPG